MENKKDPEAIQTSIDFSDCFHMNQDDQEKQNIIDIMEYKKKKDMDTFYRATERLLQHLQG